MARYIDEKDVYKLIEPSGVARVHCSQIDELPRANVVPKSEVDKAEAKIERLQTILDSYALQYGTVMDKHIVIERARQEVAREIFEEIESIYSDFPIYGNINTVILSERDLAFIKKKYTEDQNNKN